jgi:hypothetical protein
MQHIVRLPALALAAFTVCGALPPAAFAQAPNIPASAYRSGQPDTLTPPPAAVSDVPVLNRGSFSAAYAKAGRPTIAVLWNREFTDMLQQGSASQVSVDSAAEVRGAAIGNTTVTMQDTKTTQAQRRGPVERVDLQMRASFMQTITSAGVKLVDRNVVMRTTAAKQKGDLDSQQIETEALSKHARLLMEVLNTRDATSPTGWATYVSIKRLADGVVLAEGYMDGKPAEGTPKPAPKFEADPRGGFREVVQPVKVGDVGRLVGEQTLARLGEALAR